MEYGCESSWGFVHIQILSFAFQRQKSIVTPAWLRQSIKDGHPAKCGPYAAFQDLHNTTSMHCPTDNAQGSKREDNSGLPYLSLLPQQVGVKPTPRRVFENWKAKYACQRASPMTCLNQALAAELNVLTRSRELEGLSMNALSYEKSVAVGSSCLIIWNTRSLYLYHIQIIKCKSSIYLC